MSLLIHLNVSWDYIIVKYFILFRKFRGTQIWTDVPPIILHVPKSIWQAKGKDKTRGILPLAMDVERFPTRLPIQLPT